jgi:hypothetical protein
MRQVAIIFTELIGQSSENSGFVHGGADETDMVGIG